MPHLYDHPHSQQHAKHSQNRAQTSDLDPFSDYVVGKAANNLMAYGQGEVDFLQPHPKNNPRHRLVKPGSEDLFRLKDGARKAYEGVVEFWGEETVPLLRSWLDETSYVFLFVKDHPERSDGFGMTDLEFQPKPSISLTVFRGDDDYDLKRRLTGTTFFHENMHLGEPFLPPFDARPLLGLLRYYKRRGVLDDDTASALDQEDVEVLPWVAEGATVGNYYLTARIWRDTYPRLVEWLLENRHIIFPT